MKMTRTSNMTDFTGFTTMPGALMPEAVSRAFARAGAGIALFAKRRAARRELRSLDDRMLLDIGLIRGDIADMR